MLAGDRLKARVDMRMKRRLESHEKNSNNSYLKSHFFELQKNFLTDFVHKLFNDKR